MTLDIKTEITYLGIRDENADKPGEKSWKHHAYNVLLTFEGRSFDFTYRQGMAYHREPEDAWRDRRGFALPDYLSKDGPTRANRNTGLAEYPYAQRKRFHEERDANVVSGALASMASDIELFDSYNDDDIALEFEMLPSKIAEARGYVARAKAFLGHHVQEFLDTCRED